MSQENTKYFSQLDGLRCFAVISVMIGHWIAWDTENLILKHTPWGHGVILFFVLSGYLITHILLELKEGIASGKTSLKQALKTFYVRRILRIFPIYYLLIFYLFYIDYANTREIFPWLVSFTTNIYQGFKGTYIGDFNHFWSLSIEEQFYLFWPFLILMVPHIKLSRVILLIIGLSFLSRLLCILIGKENWMLGAYFTPNQFLPLAFGALLAYIKGYHKKLEGVLSNTIFLYTAVLLYSLSYYVLQYKMHLFVFNALFDEYLFAGMCFFIILKASSNGYKFLAKSILEHDIVVFIGKISYGLYLYHLFVINFFWNYICKEFEINLQNQQGAWWCYFIVVFILAVTSYYFIEKPFTNMKRYFKY